jgi:hypothetical protein
MREYEITLQRYSAGRFAGRWAWSVLMGSGDGPMKLVLDSMGTYATAGMAANFADQERRRFEERLVAREAEDAAEAERILAENEAVRGLAGAERRAWSASA